VLDAHFRSFEQQVLPLLVRKHVGVLAMKSMGSGVFLKAKVVSPIECLHYAMNLPVSVVITGIDSMKILDQAFQAVSTFKPLSHAEVAKLLARTRKVASHGEYELFKTTSHFDATAQNPRWLGGESDRVKSLTRS
jgi:aryl-alcohol dehydrogenase-like predicted oxidoreductase